MRLSTALMKLSVESKTKSDRYCSSANRRAKSELAQRPLLLQLLRKLEEQRVEHVMQISVLDSVNGQLRGGRYDNKIVVQIASCLKLIRRPQQIYVNLKPVSEIPARRIAHVSVDALHREDHRIAIAQAPG